MPWTTEDAETLRQAIRDRKGARTIQFENQSITFESIDDMLKLLAIMEGGAAVASGTSKTRYVSTSKGF